MWAEQQRIRLAEAIAQQQQLAQKKQNRKAGLLSRWKPKPRTASGVPQTPRRSKAIELQISLPKLKLPFGKIPKKRALIGGMGLAIAAAVVFGGAMFYQHQQAATLAKKKVQTTTQMLGQRTEKPSYATVMPDGKTIDQLGGWQRVSPPDKEPVFAYADKLGGVPITVSQQPLPDSFKDNVDSSMALLAQGFNAKDELKIDDMTVYVGNSIRGPQSLVFTKRNLLILIRSETKISDPEWASYIASLQ